MLQRVGECGAAKTKMLSHGLRSPLAFVSVLGVQVKDCSHLRDGRRLLGKNQTKVISLSLFVIHKTLISVLIIYVISYLGH